MKKLAIIILSLGLVLMIAACGSPREVCHRCGDTISGDPVKAGGRTYCDYDCYMCEVFGF